MNEPKDKPLDRSCTESAGNVSFLSAKCESLDQSLDSSAYHLPAFEFSSPISSIASNSAASSPDREQTLQPRLPLDEQVFNDRSSVQDPLNDSYMSSETSDWMSIEEIQSLISPPFDTPKCVEGLETIFENTILETGRAVPGTTLETGTGTPTASRINRLRRARINLNNFEEFKENVQSHKLSDHQSPFSTDFNQDFTVPMDRH